jgi:hypothetical protein
MDFEKLLEQEARKAARQDYEEVRKNKRLFLQIFQSVYPENECDDS